MTHAEIIKKLLKYRNTNIPKLAEISGVNKATLYTMLRRNQEKLKPIMYTKIADALQVPAEYFFANDINDTHFDEFFSKPIDSKEVSYLQRLFIEYKRTYSFVHDALKYAGYSEITMDEVKAIITNDKANDNHVYNLIENIIVNGKIVSCYEYHQIEGYRLLNENERNFLDEMLVHLLHAHSFRNEEYSMTPVENSSKINKYGSEWG